MLQSPLRLVGALFLCCALFACAPVAPPDLDANITAPRSESPQTPYQRWLAVTARFDAARNAIDPDCSTDAACPARRWDALVADLKQLPPRERVVAVNAALNRVPYVTAQRNWNDPAYWETPYEFLARGGQCQDYAIAKYLALAETGFPTAALHILVVRDTARALDHAILVADVDGESLVLDNQAADVVSEDIALVRYSPYYAIENNGWRSFMSPRPQLAVTPRLRAEGFTLAHYY